MSKIYSKLSGRQETEVNLSSPWPINIYAHLHENQIAGALFYWQN